VESSKTKPFLKGSVLEVAATIELPILHELHDPALKAVRKDGGIDRLCAQVQTCLRGTSNKNPQLVRHPEKGWTNLTGATLTQFNQQQGNLVCLCLVLPSNKESCPACCEFPKKVFSKQRGKVRSQRAGGWCSCYGSFASPDSSIHSAKDERGSAC